jgi:acid phosphatase (class A)
MLGNPNSPHCEGLIVPLFSEAKAGIEASRGQEKVATSSLIALLALSLGLSARGEAQQFEVSPRAIATARPDGYLSPTDVTFRNLLSAPPETGTSWDTSDRRLVLSLQSVNPSRFASAQLDASFVYPRFDQAFGKPIRRETAPTLIILLNRAMRDVAVPTFQAKEYFQRPRPFQRLRLRRACDFRRAPKPEPHPSGGSSYPSGHAAYGWATAMILARIRPERSPVLMQRAAEYAESRIVCGAHFLTDIEAGHAIAAAVLGRLEANPQFQADLARARAELDISESR